MGCSGATGLSSPPRPMRVHAPQRERWPRSSTAANDARGRISSPKTASRRAPRSQNGGVPASTPAMRTFRLCGLAHEPFSALFALSDSELLKRHARRVVATADFGFPCRVSLEDAQPGDELLLLSFEHQPAASPYRASGPIYVRRSSRRRQLAPGEIPPYVARRQISLRAYDDAAMIVAAEVVDGSAVSAQLARLFADPAVQYVHLHNAKRGCFSCTALPVPVGAAGRWLRRKLRR